MFNGKQCAIKGGMLLAEMATKAVLNSFLRCNDSDSGFRGMQNINLRSIKRSEDWSSLPNRYNDSPHKVRC
eukprot:5961724-Amphidinium_carterae.1